MKRILLYISVALCLAACRKDSDEPDSHPGFDVDGVKRTVLVYAVNHSSLRYDFADDATEMLRAFEGLDENKFQLLVYKTDSESSCGLYRVDKNVNGSHCDFVKIKSYARKQTSTSPDRIKDVLSDALAVYPNSAYDLIFWGHGSSWFPSFSDHELHDNGMAHSYGGEYNGGTSPSGTTGTNWVEIDELADAVPDRRFETIWFDCCYMTGIEVIYEFRDKCDTFVGYPTEVWSEGLAYDKVLPYLMKEQPDVVGGAKAFYEVYSSRNEPVTVAVIDMKSVETVAEASHDIITSGTVRPQTASLLNYSRMKTAPFYDFSQFMEITADLNGVNDRFARLDDALDKMVLYHAASSIDFNKRPWNVNSISGVSTHFFRDNGTRESEYYKTLDWYRRVYE